MRNQSGGLAPFGETGGEHPNPDLQLPSPYTVDVGWAARVTDRFELHGEWGAANDDPSVEGDRYIDSLQRRRSCRGGWEKQCRHQDQGNTNTKTNTKAAQTITRMALWREVRHGGSTLPTFSRVPQAPFGGVRTLRKLVPARVWKGSWIVTFEP
jgi:hypothetical protein